MLASLVALVVTSPTVWIVPVEAPAELKTAAAQITELVQVELSRRGLEVETRFEGERRLRSRDRSQWLRCRGRCDPGGRWLRRSVIEGELSVADGRLRLALRWSKVTHGQVLAESVRTFEPALYAQNARAALSDLLAQAGVAGTLTGSAVASPRPAASKKKSSPSLQLLASTGPLWRLDTANDRRLAGHAFRLDVDQHISGAFMLGGAVAFARFEDVRGFEKKAPRSAASAEGVLHLKAQRERGVFRPYVFIGAGVAYTDTERLASSVGFGDGDWTAVLQAGSGALVLFSEGFGLNVSALFSRTDMPDGFSVDEAIEDPHDVRTSINLGIVLRL